MMNAVKQTIKIGEVAVHIFSDGVFPVEKSFFFAGTPTELIRHVPERLNAPLNFCVIESEHGIMLIDAGFGTEGAAVNGHLLSQLKEAGIDRTDVELVLITHGHLDHIGGVTKNGAPVFPNARYVMHEAEWHYWKAQPDSSEWRKLAPLRDHIQLIQKDTEIYPGVTLRHTPGHTPGHLIVQLVSGQEQMLIASDLVNDPAALPALSSHIAAEVDPMLGEVARMDFLNNAWLSSSIVFACHYPFPGLGRVEKENKEWKWVPLYG